MLALAFLGAACRYWLTVFPRVGQEIHYWKQRAREIPDPALRAVALEAQRSKRGNLEGAAAFAAFVPRAHRPAVVRALVSFQLIYDYADTLSEQPCANPTQNGRRLHQALLVALDPDARHLNYYAFHPAGEDESYLPDLIDACRVSIARLPCYDLVAPAAARAAARIVAYQTLNNWGPGGSHHAYADWASRETPAGTGLRWWETGASAGSSLAIFALIAAAADRRLRRSDAAAMEDAYFPWIGALHTLLDSLIDQEEDVAAGLHCLVEHYASSQERVTRMKAIADRAVQRAYELPHGRRHAIVVAGMTSFYLSAPEASHPHARATSEQVLGAMGDLAAPTFLVLTVRRIAARLNQRWASLRAIVDGGKVAPH
jgi:tetraprenyl-beta-curcumene synthase